MKTTRKSDSQIIQMLSQPGNPTQNAYVERFNRTARNDG
jgi:transposase InsO family protein